MIGFYASLLVVKLLLDVYAEKNAFLQAAYYAIATMMAIMFIINALVIIYNVWLRRLEMNDKVDMLERVDDVLDWVYPLIYVVLLIGLVIWFF